MSEAIRNHLTTALAIGAAGGVALTANGVLQVVALEVLGQGAVLTMIVGTPIGLLVHYTRRRPPRVRSNEPPSLLDAPVSGRGETTQKV